MYRHHSKDRKSLRRLKKRSQLTWLLKIPECGDIVRKMNNAHSPNDIRKAMSEFRTPSPYIAYSFVLIDLGIYFFAIAGTLYFEHLAIRIIFGLLAGGAISTLFILGHDAAHGNFTGNRKLDKILARILFLPALHNYSLWVQIHNQQHHRVTNHVDENSWTPPTFQQYSKYSNRKKLLTRFYRSLLGVGFYYLIERWWKNKFIPYGTKKNLESWIDLTIMILFLLVFTLALYSYTSLHPELGFLSTITISMIIPFIAWNYLIGLTVYIQHTHRSIPWLNTSESNHKEQIELAVNLILPNWFHFLTHNLYLHSVHHINPTIPCYRIHKANTKLEEMAKDALVREKLTPMYVLKTLKQCKLYDFQANSWVDFNGAASS